MAFEHEEEDLAFAAAYEDNTPTPPGWKRKLVPRIGKGMVPVRTDVIYITPSGEEFKSRAQLQRYLKANKGSPSLSEFIWIVDEMLQRSTRSKSAPMVKLHEIPSRAVSKRKPGAGNEVGIGKGMHTGKAQNPEEDLRIIKGNHLKNVDMVTLSEGGNDEGNEFTGSSPASAKRKRSVKVRINRGPTQTMTKSATTNGVADISNKDDKADETVKKSSFNKASKRKRSKGRSVSKKVATDPSDDVRQEADVGVNADVSSAGVTNVESDANIRGEGDGPEETADVEHSIETMAVNA